MVAFEEIVCNAGGCTAAITAVVLLGAALVEERERGPS